MFLHVAVPRPLDEVFIYRCPPELKDQAAVGKRVIISFGRQRVTGYIVGISAEIPASLSQEIVKKEIKPIYSILDTTPLIDQRMHSLCKWASDYYMFPIGMVLKTALSGIPEGRELKAPEKRYDVLKAFREKAGDGGQCPPYTRDEGMKGFTDERSRDSRLSVKLTEQQGNVLCKIRQSIEKGEFAVHLLHGITGSGKTEVYMHAVEEVAKKGKSGIILVPEIAITPQLITRFVARFGERVAVLHSGLTHAERVGEWIKIQEGKVDVVIGVRSAVFAPFNNLGVIVIDEEHEHTYKQEDGFKYNARDLAIMRAKQSKAVVILGSATPSLESYYNTQTKKYMYLSLPERINERPLPSVSVVDMRKKEGFSIFTDELLDAIRLRIDRGEQSLLFLNRRGFSPFLLCLDCGSSPDCPNCSVSLTYHKGEKALCCHYCDYKIIPPDTCPQCNSYRFKAFGVGTERVEEELKKIIPDIRIVRMDRDTTTKRNAYHRIFQSMENREADVLIGTQMVTKGLDLPDITLVGVLLADSTLHLPDFRSAERTFQFLTQVAGRSGRGTKVGEVIIQTFNPDHYSIRYASRHDFEGFYMEESSYRKALGYPPYKRLVRILIKGNNKERVILASEKVKEILSNNKAGEIDLLGPVPAPFSKMRGKYRQHIILKGKEAKLLNRVVKKSLDVFSLDKSYKGVQVEVDVDPLSLL